MILHGRCFVGIAGWIQILDFILVAKVPVYPTIKLWPIVSYYQLCYSKPTNDVLPYQLNDIFVLDRGKRFNFYPFAEIVCRYQ